MSQPQEKRTSRREFARTVAALAVAAPLAPACAAAASLGVGAPVRPNVARDPADVLPETGALLEVVRHRYGNHLMPDQLEAVRQGIEGSLRSAERLRKVRLGNGEEPGFVFAAFLAEG